MELQLNTWTGESGIVRDYITNVHELIGFKPRRNKQGKVVGGSYQGHADIASKWARELNDIVACIADGELVILGGDADTQAEVREVLAPLADAHLVEIASEQEAAEVVEISETATLGADEAQARKEQRAADAKISAEHTGIELRCRREALGLSQKLIADAFGTTQAAWSRWESGKRAIPAGVLAGMAGLEDAMRAEVDAHLSALSGGRRPVMRPTATYLPNARAIPEGIDQELIADTIGRVAAGRAYAMAWLEEGMAHSQIQIDEIRR